MTERERQLACIRYIEIEAELTALSDGRVVDSNLADVEAVLLEEQEEIEYRLGMDSFERRDD